MIVGMKKARIVVLKDDKSKLLKSLQKHSVIMPINFDNQKEIIDNDIQRTQSTLKLLKNYQGKQKFFVDANIVSRDEFEEINPDNHKLLNKIEETNEEISRLKADVDSLENEIASLEPFRDLDINLTQRRLIKSARVFTGFIPNFNVNALKNAFDEFGGIINFYGNSGSSIAVMLVAFIDEVNSNLEIARSFGFTEFELPIYDGYVLEIITNKENSISKLKDQITENYKYLSKIALESDKLKLLNDQLLTRNEIENVTPMETIQTMFLEGWVREDQLDILETAIQEAVEIYDLEVVDPNEDETPPTALKNKKFVEPFESVTEMFAVPTREEGIDPNPWMAPWYWIIFGMMMGDVGYGLLLLLFSAFIIKAKRPKGNSLRMLKVFMYSGVTTIIWGVLFGSYFGVEFNPIIFVPMNDPLSMLILSIVIGVLHVLTGIIARAYYNIKKKNYIAALSDDISWAMIFTGGLLAVVGMLPDFGIPNLIVKIVSYVGIGIVVIGLLLIITLGGHSKPSLFGKITGGVSGLTGIVSYASDVLSYARILALSLSTAVISMVMNMLAGMLQGNPIGFVFSFAVYIVGHIFNIAMGMLSAYVHDGRLQYIEFYGKFYEGGGYAFKPLSPKLQYIDEIN